nr:Rpn family recombination-promoting nuclease/putative transposase [Bacillus cereus]
MLDILVIIQGEAKANIEIQLRNTKGIFKGSLYYWSRLYTSQLE